MLVIIAKQIKGHRCFIIDQFYQYTKDTQDFLKNEDYELNVYEIETKYKFQLFVDVSDNKLMCMLEDGSVVEPKLIFNGIKKFNNDACVKYYTDGKDTQK